MDELKKLQGLYKAGKIKKDEYLKQLKELLDSKEISQEEHDEAKEYDPGDPDNKPIYTQAEVDGMVTRKAVALVRRALKDAGVNVDVPNKELLGKVAELAKAGGDQKPPTATEQEIADLRKKAKKADDADSTIKRLQLENGVLKAAGKFNPHNPAQVVRGLSDYMGLLEEDDEGGYTPKSIEKAIKRMAENEPNLFKQADDEDGNDEGGGNDDGGRFRGKGPGGGTPGGDDKKAAERAKKKTAALEMMGIKTEKK